MLPPVITFRSIWICEACGNELQYKPTKPWTNCPITGKEARIMRKPIAEHKELTS